MVPYQWTKGARVECCAFREVSAHRPQQPRACGSLRRLSAAAFGVTPLKHLDNNHLNPMPIVVLQHIPRNCCLRSKRVLSAEVGHILLGLDSNVRISEKTAPFDFDDSRFSVIRVIIFFIAEFCEITKIILHFDAIGGRPSTVIMD